MSFDGYVIPATVAQMQRVEKIFLNHNNILVDTYGFPNDETTFFPYFTYGQIAWDQVNLDSFYLRVADGKHYITAQDFIDHAKQQRLKADGTTGNLVQALRDEFSGTDLIAWFEANKVLKQTVFDNE